MIQRKYPFEGKRDMNILNQIEDGVNMDISEDTDLNDLLKKTLEKEVSQRISWNDFFNHSFLTKKFPETVNNSNSQKNINQLVECKQKLENSRRNLSQIMRQYSAIIFSVDKEIAKEFDNNIRNVI
jgi:serine/threonine protein kinase